MTTVPYRRTPEGVMLAVRLVPRANRNGLDGVVVGAEGRAALQLRLVAPPVEGAANAALVAFLATALELRKGAVTIRSGERSRLKVVILSGDGEAIEGRLAEWIVGED
ncbi:MULTISPECIES: DUF167 domain-containing protein [unclassified Acidisoma]|uniref:DUF167 domain-containing protein n=1 Tax=unclassified Acidisoma TaxID=2634065 RepID=UPI001C203FDB|nr:MULTISPECIES: DUF167 domain-containing protein [unclassified Acidisoma]